VSDTEIIGYARQVENYYTSPWLDYTLHFVIRFDKPFKSIGFWNNNKINENVRESDCKLDSDFGAYIN
jgi:hypothetical protein